MIPRFGARSISTTVQGPLLAQVANDSPEHLFGRRRVPHRLAKRDVRGTRVPNGIGTDRTFSYVGDDISAYCTGAIVSQAMQVDVARVRGHQIGLTWIGVGISRSPGLYGRRMPQSVECFRRATGEANTPGGPSLMTVRHGSLPRRTQHTAKLLERPTEADF